MEMFSRNKQYDRVMKTLSNALAYEQSDPAQFRHHVLQYYYRYGWKPTVEAFKLGKSTLYEWKQRYEQSGKKLTALIPQKTKPNRVRVMNTDWRLVQFIREFRQQYGNIGREKIKIFLDQYASEIGIESISTRTISKVIQRRRLFFDHPRRIKRKNKFSRDRTKKAPKATAPGYVEVDCIVLFVGGSRHNFVCCIDIYTKFAHVKKVSTISSQQTKATLQEFEIRTQHKVHTVQTDNGSEFFKTFHAYLEDQEIKHQFIYPHSPKINGVVERFNRTFQEEFINRSDEIYFDRERFEVKLTNYLEWYNTKRPHASLEYQSPIQFMNNSFPESICL